MLTATWVRGLLARRRGRLVSIAAGVAVAVSLLAAIGAFLSGTTAAMTDRAVSRVAVDWQVETQPGKNAAKVLATVRSFPGVKTALPVAFADTTGFTATPHKSETSSGAGAVVGIPPNYRTVYPDQLSQFVGAQNGVLIAQQLAADLEVKLGDVVTIHRAGLGPVSVRVQGIVDVPSEATLFQKVGAPLGAKPQPTPSGVIFLPLQQWHSLFDPLARARPDLVRNQVHVALTHVGLPRDPSAAYNYAGAHGRNLEVKLLGSGLVANNLAHALAKARSDSLYARIVFLFLGLPGAILAGLITATIAGAGADRRRREQALMRTRGASTRMLVKMALGETLAVAVVGGALGLLAAFAIGRWAFGSKGFGATTSGTLIWSAGAFGLGLLVSAAAICLPAWRDARALTVSDARRVVGRTRGPWWARYWLDLVALAGSGLVFYWTGSNGYKLVLAVEGTPLVSVNYYSFLAPILLWIGVGLLIWRIADFTLTRGRGLMERLTAPLAGGLARTVAATMARQHRQLAGALTLVALTVSFAGSTAAFNATYKQQAEIDARLSTGADVVVTETPNSHVGPGAATALRRISGVRSVEPLQHRFVYLGADLQDLYGVNASTIVKNAQLRDSFFKGGTAKELFARLAARPDAALVSNEAATSYQLKLGDPITLRIQDNRTKKQVPVTFTYAGVAMKFPSTASDSFFVGNASFIASKTGNNAVEKFLLQTSASPPAVAKKVTTQVGNTARVSDITSKRKKIGGSLTATEIAGLTRVELGFALLLAAAATGLLLWLGLAERRRTFAIADALGAKSRQLGSFIWSETAFVTIGGFILGAAGATALAYVLVKVLTGVFDPPPTGLAVPWQYLGALTAVAAVAVTLAALAAIRSARRPAVDVLRDL
jgi:putative ABC transport system permease protein